MNERAFLEPVITATLGALSTEEATRRLDEAGVANARVNDLQAVWEHPQLQARRRWTEIETPAGAMPALLPSGNDGFAPRMDAVPALGQHTESVLNEMGFSAAEIRAMKPNSDGS